MFKVIESSRYTLVSVCEIIGLGCIVRTQTLKPDTNSMYGELNIISEALVFVPNVRLEDNQLVPIPITPDGPVPV